MSFVVKYPRWLRLAGLPGINRRVVRGGSWNNNQNNARTAYRNNINPNNRNNNVGFRLVCASHILTPPATAQVRRLAFAGLSRALQPLPALETLPELAADQGLRPKAQDRRWRR